MYRIICLFLTLQLFSLSCTSENDNIIVASKNAEFNTENVVILVIDGSRFIDTWGDNRHENIPHQSNLANEGVFFRNFFNDGETFTLSGHAAITTGSYENIDNDGSEWPSHPSLFQTYLATTRVSPEKTWIITSKSKLHALGNSKNLKWRNSFMPSIDAEDREDSLTLQIALDHLDKYTPTLALIHFRGPDKYGHGKDWKGYVNSIRDTDRYVKDIWDFIQANEKYKGKTALFVTNDHGRHLDEIGRGFVDHGDRCEGCKHISLLALGPDFTPGEKVDGHYGQIDIAPTISKLLNISWHGEGQPIVELIK